MTVVKAIQINYEKLSDLQLAELYAENEPDQGDALTFWLCVNEMERRKKIVQEMGLVPHPRGGAHLFDPKNPRYLSACPAGKEVVMFICDKGGASVSMSLYPEEAMAYASALIQSAVIARANQKRPEPEEETPLVSNTLDLEAA